MLYLLLKTMNINRFNNTTKSQQRHNKKQICCVNPQQTERLLCNGCTYNSLYNNQISLFRNKTTKFSQPRPFVGISVKLLSIDILLAKRKINDNNSMSFS